MSRHGKVIMPFGKYKGISVSALPDTYLCWFLSMPTDKRWNWLIESIKAELRHRGFEPDEIIVESSPPTFNLRCTNCSRMFESTFARPLCPLCKRLEGLRQIAVSSHSDSVNETRHKRMPSLPAHPRRAIALE